MKLALITPEWGAVAGGIATYYRHLVPALRDAGVEVTVFCGSPFVTGSGSQEGAQLLAADALEAHRRPFRQFAPLGQLQHHLAAAWALFDQVQQQDFDLVECTDWGLTALPWLELAQPVIMRCHASLAQVARREHLPGEAVFQSVTALLEQSALRLADGVVTYADANAAEWTSVLARDVPVVRPAFPVAPAATAAPDGAAGLVAGKIQRWKGVETLCRALEHDYAGPPIRWFGRDMPYDDAGTTQSTASVMERRYPEVWNNLIRPAGMVPPVQLVEERAGAAFMVVPSSWDVFNFTVVEGMAQGLPVVVSSGAGASELIDHGVSGWVFEAGNAEACRACLDELLGLSAAARQAVGEAAREMVATRLEPARAAADHRAGYEAALASPRRVPAPLWRDLRADETGGHVESDLMSNVAGRDLVRALLKRGRERIGRR
ncbi:MAG: glycosyltransferase family 4 protein [Pseudomonadota bacterium]